MKAMVWTKYGPPDVLQRRRRVRKVESPGIGGDEEWVFVIQLV